MRLSEAARVARQPMGTREHVKQGGWRLVKVIGPVVGIVVLLAGAAAFGVFGLSQRLTTHAAAATDPNCVLLLPNQPLTAQGLATPYQLAGAGGSGACNESNASQAAFVQGAILDPATGAIAIYNPLVVDKGAKPAIAPTVPKLPAHAIVALWIGFNGRSLHLRGPRRGHLQLTGAGRANGMCVDGLGSSNFGQVAYCNAPRFFAQANQLIARKKITPPALGTAKDGLPCPTVRDFSVVDQDQSDNVTTTYLSVGDQMAQNTAANRAALAAQGAHVITNGSDNRLLAIALDSALGCTPWMAPDLADNGQLTTAQPLAELQAAAHQAAPVATVPSADPMVLVNGHPNLLKQNLYRFGVDQVPVRSAVQARQDQLAYCKNVYNVAPQRILRDKPYTESAGSPDALAASDLYAFMARRFNFTYSAQGLGCEQLLGKPSPITVQYNASGVAVDATIDTAAKL
jgi:hypothetical protein